MKEKAVYGIGMVFNQDYSCYEIIIKKDNEVIATRLLLDFYVQPKITGSIFEEGS